MKIAALRLFNVKRFANCGVAIEGIGDGVNVLCAVNEFGKSTSFEALHALFFQAHSSTAADVRNLRPYVGGSPVVEADITTAEGRYRITKQFFGGCSARVTDLGSGRLLAQAGEAENFITGLIKGGTAGPAGLLWVRQGVTGIERRSTSEENTERQARASLIQSVQGEVEAVTGGRRMVEVMVAASEALSELVTPTGRPRAGGRLAAANNERDRLADAEQRLSGEVAALREALDRRAVASRRLAELECLEDREERRRAVDAAQVRFDQANAQGERLKAAEAKLELARVRREGADRDMNAFRAALARAIELREKLSEAERRRGEAVAKRRTAAEAIGKARAEAETAEEHEEAARQVLDRLEATMRARDAAERLAELQERLSRAEDIRYALEDCESKLAVVKIPPNAIEELQSLEIDLAKYRAAHEATRPCVALTYEPGATTRVTMNGSELADGEERAYDDQAELSVPGIGTVTLRSNRPPRNDDRLALTGARRRTLLSSMDVHDLAAARARQVRAQELDGKVREMRGQLLLLAPDGLPRLREQVAVHGDVEVQALELRGDPVEVRATLVKAEERRRTTRLALHEVEPMQASADDEFVRTEAVLAECNAVRAHVDAVLGPQDERGTCEQALVKARDDLDGAFAAAEAHAESLRASAVDLDSAEAALRRARSAEEAADREAGTLREAIAGLNAEIRAHSEEAVEETWRETAEALSTAETRASGYSKEVAVLQRLSSALESARTEARELYLKPVMNELRPLLGLLFEDASIKFDEKTLLPQTIMRNGQEEEVDRLSGGMREQLSVLTRLAFARLLARDGRPAPVILDDALVYSDDDRIEKMFDALHRQSRDQQIIVFSCRQRAFQKLGGNVLKTTQWRPSPNAS